jgi:hypothetical protein
MRIVVARPEHNVVVEVLLAAELVRLEGVAASAQQHRPMRDRIPGAATPKQAQVEPLGFFERSDGKDQYGRAKRFEGAQGLILAANLRDLLEFLPQHISDKACICHVSRHDQQTGAGHLC